MAKKDLCRRCTGQCCRYFALPLDTPEDRDDFDDIRWYLSHKGVTVFVDKGDWYIQIANRCRHLAARDHRCRIYDRRPRICRQYSRVDCDQSQAPYDYHLHFTRDKEMAEYIRIRFDNNILEKQRASKRRKGRTS